VQVPAILIEADGAKVSTTPAHGLDQDQADELCSRLQGFKAATLKTLDTVSSDKHPPKPYVTSSLQQDSFGLLGMGVKATMSTAQELFEGVQCGQ
jgi:DNA topoisomerase I